MCHRWATDVAKLDNLSSPPPQPYSLALKTANLMKRSPIKYLNDIFKTAMYGSSEHMYSWLDQPDTTLELVIQTDTPGSLRSYQNMNVL